jgi:hypothetical protein
MKESILTSEAGHTGSISIQKGEAKMRHRESDSTNSRLMVHKPAGCSKMVETLNDANSVLAASTETAVSTDLLVVGAGPASASLSCFFVPPL